MRKPILLIILACLAVPARSSNLALLKINNKDELRKAASVIENAHGIFDNSFIVVLNDIQQKLLLANNIQFKVIVDGVSIENYYFWSHPFNEFFEAPAEIKPVYSHGNAHIVEYKEGTFSGLASIETKLIPLSEIVVPLSVRAELFPLPQLSQYPTDTLADLISQDTLYSYVTALEGYATRYILSDSIHSAEVWIKSKFRHFGYDDVYFQEFTVTKSNHCGVDLVDFPCKNVICFKPGTTRPDKLIVVGAHFDSINNQEDDCGMIWAPGADDNASGTAAVLELARILHDYQSNKSIMFAAFSFEEMGGYGSETVAESLLLDSYEVELMLNFDMIGNEEDTSPDVDLYAGWSKAYYNVLAEAAVRISGLSPNFKGPYASSDDMSFALLGFNSACVHENDFNPYWHTGYDLATYMDFQYMAKNVELSAAAIGVIDNAPEAIPFDVYDVGDGHSILVDWSDYPVPYDYGITYGYYIQSQDTAWVPEGEYNHIIDSLVTGIKCYFGVFGITEEGIPPLSVYFKRLEPMLIPRTPHFTIDLDSGYVIPNWSSNLELDFSHYRLMRRESDGVWQILIDNYLDTSFVDSLAQSYTEYQYMIFAVDEDGYESDTSDIISAVKPTFDRGLLLVDETQPGGINPTESEQNFFYNSVLDGIEYDKYEVDSGSTPLFKSLLGQYNQLFYVDGDDLLHLMDYSLDTIQWFTRYNTDLLIAGWETIVNITGQTYFYGGDFFHDELGILYTGKNVLSDFTGAAGEGGWPDLALKPDAPYNGRLPDIQIFIPAAGAEVVARFNSYSGNPFYSDKPVGIAFDTYNGKRVILGCPLYWLTEESAQAFVQKVIDYFAAESEYFCGDANGDRIINLLDIIHLIAYLYQNGPPPLPFEVYSGDASCNCDLNILDITYLIAFLYQEGPPPCDFDTWISICGMPSRR